MQSWGIHALIDMKGCDPAAIRSAENVRDFIYTLATEIGMVRMGDPVILHCETHDPAKVGITFFQLIQDSNISGHLVDIDNSGYIDVFSCKEFDPAQVREIVEHFFKPVSMTLKVVPRG